MVAGTVFAGAATAASGEEESSSHGDVPVPASLAQQVLLDEPAGSDRSIARATISDARSLRPHSDSATFEVRGVSSRLIPSQGVAGLVDDRTSAELAGVSYRWWLSSGRSDMGLGVGTVGRVVTLPGDGAQGIRTVSGSAPVITFGWRYRVSNQSAVYADASGARGLGLDGTGDYLNTKAGVEWKTRKSRFGLERGALGIQFDSGYRMSLRLRKGGVGIYLRSQF